jgi:hypothetical protein
MALQKQSVVLDRLFCFLSEIEHVHLSQPVGKGLAEIAIAHTPFPVAAQPAGEVHARLATQI